MKTLLAIFFSMLGSFISYKLYITATDWNFLISFLGGSITMLLVVFVKYNKLFFRD